MVIQGAQSEAFSNNFGTFTLQEIRRKMQEALENDVNKSQQPAKRQAKNNQNETEPIDKHNHFTNSSKDNKDPQLTTNGQDSNFAADIIVGAVSEARGFVSTLRGRSKGRSLTPSSSKQWEAHMETVKSFLHKVIPIKWVHIHNISNGITNKEIWNQRMITHVRCTICYSTVISITCNKYSMN